jgi:hypothetical protein
MASQDRRTRPVVRFKCPECGEELEADASASGEVLDCPLCRDPVEVPYVTAAQMARRVAGARSQSRLAADAPGKRGGLTFGVLGSLLLIIGVFAPVVKMPVMGTINYLANVAGGGGIVLALAAGALLATVSGRFRWL